MSWRSLENQNRNRDLHEESKNKRHPILFREYIAARGAAGWSNDETIFDALFEPNPCSAF